MKTITLFCCALLTAAAMQAQQILHVPSQYPSIQSAIMAADSGDIVLAAPGTYAEQINFLGKKWLTVASEFYTTGDPSKIETTVIDGSMLPNPDS